MRVSFRIAVIFRHVQLKNYVECSVEKTSRNDAMTRRHHDTMKLTGRGRGPNLWFKIPTVVVLFSFTLFN